ncbi:Importin-11 [Escovopsis weberi]|uniref:Importin-11 n=1 Tax=Escovopsis weberi TaxID=150374 RepID=A0A0M8N0V7_ESCWE|nr:Importin-11 [Escovopsis weberi]
MFRDRLPSVFLDTTLPLEIRFLAIIQLKNGIDKYWRTSPTAQPGVGLGPEEKKSMRSRLFQGTVGEAEKNLALHNALAIAKIVRIDYPVHWPDAMSNIIDLVRSLRNGNQQHLSGALLVLLRVVKELGTARLRKFQTALQSFAPEVLHLLAEIYSERSACWISHLSGGSGSEEEGSLAMHNSLLALRVLRRLVIFGFEHPHRDRSVEHFWTLSQNQFGPLLAFVGPESSIPESYRELVGKHLLQFTNLHIDIAEQHPSSFAFLPNSLSLVHAYWNLVSNFAEVFDKSAGIRQGSGDQGGSKAKTEGSLQERLALKGLILLRACVRIAFPSGQSIKFRSAETKADEEHAQRLIKSELFKDELVIEIANAIISHLFVFRRSDLEAWEDDPQDWEQQEQSEGNAYEWEVRPCAERLFLDLLIHFKELLVPPLLVYFQTAQSPQADIATKEAVYTAMGLSAAHVFKFFDFDAILASTVANDAQQHGGLHKVLRRRIAILISQWAPVSLNDTSRSLAYQIFRHFLDPKDETNDVVVRISAARQLRMIADELDFNVEVFLPHASDILSALLDLVQVVDHDETKLAILESARIIVTRMEEHVSQFGDQLMAALPRVWEESGSEGYMIKQAIIAIFAALVMSMGQNSQRYHGFMMPLLSEAARPGTDMHIHLIDEVLELWDAILTQSTSPLAREVVELAELALPMLEYQLDTAHSALGIIESYILLAPAEILKDELRRQMMTALAGTLESRSRPQVSIGTRCIEYMLRFAAELGGASGVSLVVQDMLEMGFLDKIMEGLRDAWEAHQTTGPNRKASKLNTVTEGDYLAILARIALAEPSLFAQMLDRFGGADQAWGWLSAEWFSHQSGMDNLQRQKLYVLGLTRLLELGPPMQGLVLGKLQDYLDMWTGVILELQDGDVAGDDTLMWGEIEVNSFDTPRRFVELQMMSRDPVHSVHALHFVRERLQDAVARVGGEAAFEEGWAVNVDQEVMARFRNMLGSQ